MSLGDFQALVGIDVSEGRLDVHLRPGGASAGFAHDGRGIGRLIAWIASHDRPLAVVEATGGLERGLVRSLDRARSRPGGGEPATGPPVPAGPRLLSPRPIASTPVCWRCSPSASPPPRAPRAPRAVVGLGGAGAAPGQLVTIRDGERSRARRGHEPPELIKSPEAHLAWLVAEIARLDNVITAQLVACAPQRQRADLLVSAPSTTKLPPASPAWHRLLATAG